MKTTLQPLQLLLMMFSGWVNRHQQKVIEYLIEENRVLKELHKGKRLRDGPSTSAFTTTFMITSLRFQPKITRGTVIYLKLQGRFTLVLIFGPHGLTRRRLR